MFGNLTQETVIGTTTNNNIRKNCQNFLSELSKNYSNN